MKLIDVFYNFKSMGLPFSGGWAEQPSWVVYTINILSAEYNQQQAKKAEDARASGRQSRGPIGKG